MKVMLLGRLENPKIECLRELYHHESESKIIPIGVKRSAPTQKFRVPFKNTSPNQDAEIEFTFVKLPKSQRPNLDLEEEDECEVDLNQYLDFYC